MSFLRSIQNLPPEVKAAVSTRVVAKFIDFFIVFALAAIFPYPLGPFLGFAYSLLGDGMSFWEFKSQSVGKRIMGLQVYQIVVKRQGNWKDSLIRNSPVGLVTFFSFIPLWGWVIAAIVGAPLLVLEVYLMATVGHGHRLGDVLADTEVTTYRESMIPIVPPTASRNGVTPEGEG